MRRMLVLTLSLLSIGVATTYRALSLEDILDKAQLGFYGEVVAVDVEERDGDPWTVVSFDVTEALVGAEEVLEEGSTRLTLAFLGGSLPSGEVLNVNLMPSFSVGEQVLVMAYTDTLYSPIVGFRQGLWRDTELGLRGEEGQYLSLDEEGALVQGPDGAARDAVLEALKRALEETP